MRSKILKLIAVLAICFLIGAALVSCGDKDGKGEAGATGATGATGNGIATIRLSDDGLKYIVTYTNGQTEEVDVPTAPCPNNCENVTTFEFVLHTRAYNAETEEYEFTEGKYLDVCNDCGRSQIVTEVRHSMTSAGIVPATCTEEGFEGAICTVCAHAEKVEGTEIPALEHSTDVYTPVLENDKNICEQGGYIICVCDNLNRDGSVCGEVFTKKVEPLGHKVETWIKTSNAPTLLAGATDALTGVCVNCTQTLTLDLEALNDEDYAYAVTKAPTCTLEGTGTFTFTVPAEFVLEEGLVEENVTVTTVGEQKFEYNSVVPATDHYINGVSILTYEKVNGAYVHGQAGIQATGGENPKCGDEAKGVYLCSECEIVYIVDIVGPHVGEVTETAPTCTEGNKFTCDECDQTWFGEEEKLGHDLVPTLTANATFDVFTFEYDCSRCDYTEGKLEDVEVGAPEKLEFCDKNGTATYKYEYVEGKFATVVQTLPSNLNKHQFVDGNGDYAIPDADGYYSYNKYAAYITVTNGVDMTPCGAIGEGLATCSACGAPIIVDIKTNHEYKLDTEDSRYVASTCTTLGTDVFVCTRTDCDDSYTTPATVDIETLHKYVYTADPSGVISAVCACGATEDGVHGITGTVTWEITTDPSCTEKGVKTYTISAEINGQPWSTTRTEEVDKVPHKLGGVDITTLWNAEKGAYNYNKNFTVAGTNTIVCNTENLYDAVYTCDDCGILYTVKLYITHAWDEGTQTKAPTCTEKGETTYKCTICETGEMTLDDIPATDHGAEYLTAEVTTAPTATVTGVLTVHCADCGQNMTVVLPALTDALYTKTVVSTADCYNKGQNKYTINNFETVYGKFYVEVLETVNETEHTTYVEGVTDTEEFTVQELRVVGGEEVLCNVTYTVYKCENCGTYIKVVGSEVVVPVEDNND